jgi:sucrose-6-phosphate hydrolase SacC (GH32 family)
MLSTLVYLSLFATPSNDLVITDFSGSSYAGWKVTGTAFGEGPISVAKAERLEIKHSTGPFVITSEIHGDEAQGRLISPGFRIQRKFIAFRIAGGDHERKTCLDLLINGKVVRSATGRNAHELEPQSWDVRRFMDKVAQIQVVDEASGGWGHINIDRVVQTDHPEIPPAVKEALYHETLRPQFHFTARQWTMDRLNPGMKQEGWINDLNGLIYYDHEYHLFAQRWSKCWLHAVSKDLVHWTELEPAFWEESLDSGVQSGTCVVDYADVSQLSPDRANPPLLAFAPRNDNRSQCMYYSLDKGRSWKFYEDNPVLVHPERDPKVFWYAPRQHWVMMLYGDGQYHILTSKNLVQWTDQHKPIADSFECPDFFELPVDGNPKDTRWVLIQGNGNYSIGRFDGTEFKEDVPRHACDLGPNFYATQSWANTETGDGRRIQAAWMRGADFPNMPFNQEISFPCELSLHSTPGGLRVFRQPIQEISKLEDRKDTWRDLILKDGEVLPLAQKGQCYRITADVSLTPGAKATFMLRGEPVVLTSKTVASGTDPASVQGQVETVEILLDRASIETYVNHGEISATRFVLPKQEGLSLKVEGGTVTVKKLTVASLKSVWPKSVAR